MNRREAVSTLTSLLAGAGLSALWFKTNQHVPTGEVTTTSALPSINRRFAATKIHRTDQTAKAFPVIDARAGEWANGSTAHIYFIAPEDILGFAQSPLTQSLLAQAFVNIQSCNRGVMSLSALNQFMEENEVASKMLAATKNFIETKWPEIFDAINNPDSKDNDPIKGLSDNILFGSASTTRFTQNVHSDTFDSAIIITPYYTTTKKDSLCGLSGISFDHDFASPGTDAEWTGATIAHEIGHTVYVVDGIEAEVKADQFFIDVYNAELTKPNGFFKSKELDLWRAACRATASVIYSNDSAHAVSAPHENNQKNKNNYAISGNQYSIAIVNLRKMIAGRIVEDSPSIANIYTSSVLSSIEADVAYLEGKEKIILKDGERKHLIKIIQALTTRSDENIDIDSLYKSLSTDTRTYIDSALTDYYEFFGEGYIQQDPAATYKATAALYTEGLLDEMPLEKQYAWKFLTAARDFFPDYFKADPKTVFSPPSGPVPYDKKDSVASLSPGG